MCPSTPPGLAYDPAGEAAFYDRRFQAGYMDRWPEEKLARVAEVVRAVPLPPAGRALDFGCGQGIFTDLLQAVLGPGWEVWGIDVSPTAIAQARQRFAGPRFAVADELPSGLRFEFLLSHHVLEHVSQLPAAAARLAELAADAADMLHVLPCGNPGSLEHRVAACRRDGIDPSRENRFFFEEPGHLRRLTTAQCAALFAPLGFDLRQAWYANQEAGAVDWITQAGPGFVWRFADPAQARDAAAARHLRQVRRRLVAGWAWRIGASVARRAWRKRHKNWRHWLLLAVGLATWPWSWPGDRWYRARAAAEWRADRSNPAGSEMYLYFHRGRAGGAGQAGQASTDALFPPRQGG